MQQPLAAQSPSSVAQSNASVADACPAVALLACHTPALTRAGAATEAALSPEARLQQRDARIREVEASLQLAEQRAQRLQQRIQDLFGAEAADVEPPKLQYASKHGARRSMLASMLRPPGCTHQAARSGLCCLAECMS